MSSRRKTIAAGALVLVIVGAAIVYIFSDTSDDRQRTQANLESRPVPAREARDLTHGEKNELTQAALNDPLVLRLTGGHRPHKRYLLRWTSEDASELLGAGVYVAFRPAASLRGQRLPFYLTPVEGAPPDTPYQHRTRVMTATGVTEFKVRVLLDGHEVVEVEPLGPKLHVLNARILGPQPGPAYIPKGD